MRLKYISAMPSLATVKRLFAVSHNRCAFPKCSQPLVHEEKLTGRICHIQAASPGGPRFESLQSAEDRDHFDNLLLLCPIHHDVIDADELAYTTARLQAMKSDHEAALGKSAELSDAQAVEFILNLNAPLVTNGSIVITNNQSGGQAAHVINNFGPPRRTVSTPTRLKMLGVLAQHPPGQIGFASTQGDSEANSFKSLLAEIFREAGWQVQDMQTFMFFGLQTGIVLTIPFNAAETGSPQVVAAALTHTGQEIAGNRGDMANECGIYVQVWHATA